jgi:hypothetical protein
MKELNIILFTLILAIFVSCQADLNPGDAFPSAPVTKSDDSSSIVDTLRLSKEDALKIVEPITSKYPDRWVDISNDIIPAGTSIAYNPLGHIREVDDLKYYNSPNFDAWLLVIEGDLSIMGIQPITHIFVNVVTGEYITVELNGRAIIEWDSSRYVFEYPAEDGTLEVRDYSLPPERSSSHGKYAVIISGGTDKYNNTSCFFNDTQRIYNILIDSLHYSKNAIFVYLSDGTDPTADQKTGPNSYTSSISDLDGDGTTDTIAALKSRLNNGFSILGLWAQPGDELLVFMTDNGYYDGSFNLWDGEALYPSELNNLLNKINPLVKIDVVMGQSYSGAFISTIAATNRTITTSCAANETAHRNTYYFTYFLNKWTNAISTYADVSTTDIFNDAYASPLELYNSANSWILSNYSEHPQYSSTPSDLGERYSIDGYIIPYITGGDYLYPNTNSVFTLHDGPDSPYLYAWLVGNNASIVSYTDSTVTVNGVLPNSQYYAPSTTVTLSVIVDGYMHNITKPINSVWGPGTYVCDNFVIGGNGFYSITTHPGAYGYYWQCTNPDWQIINQSGGYVFVTEGFTDNPVYLIVSFNEPQGGTITIIDLVYG